MDWRKDYSQEILRQIIQNKLDLSYQRPSFLDAVAKIAIVVAERSTCLFYEIGAVILREKQILSIGYNGSSSGDVHCIDVGCARVIEGQLKKGAGLCRGGHAEMNAISNAAQNGVSIRGGSLMITHFPCFVCAKQIANSNLRKVWYIFTYGEDKEQENTKKYLRRLNIEVELYQSGHLKQWLKLRGLKNREE